MEDHVHNDAALMTVLMDRFKKTRFPRATSLSEKVNRGETLSHFDLVFLKEVSEDIHNLSSFLERQPACQKLATEMINLCKDIAEKGLDNENEK